LSAAARDPHSWAPAAGAVAVGLAGWDDEISDWAVRNHPLFGSREQAIAASDNLRAACRYGMLLTNAGGLLEKSVPETALDLLRQELISSTTIGLTGYLKSEAGRTRPDGSNQSSFPSGHATSAFTYAALGRQSLRDLRVPDGARLPLSAGLDALAVGTAWARVEAGKHYPTDVMAGAAIANFVSVFMNKVLRPGRRGFEVGFQVQPETVSFTLAWRR